MIDDPLVIGQHHGGPSVGRDLFFNRRPTPGVIVRSQAETTHDTGHSSPLKQGEYRYGETEEQKTRKEKTRRQFDDEFKKAQSDFSKVGTPR